MDDGVTCKKEIGVYMGKYFAALPLCERETVNRMFDIISPHSAEERTRILEAVSFKSDKWLLYLHYLQYGD